MSKANVRALLVSQFKTNHVDNALKYYEAATEKFIARQWDRLAQDLGKFAEAVTKASMAFGNITPTTAGRQFKVTNELRRFESHQPPLPEVLRMVVPKALVFITELVNNRLGRHDTELDPHEMDAFAVMPIASWVLAELVRFCSPNTDQDAAAALIQELTAKFVPFFEVIEGRTYVRNGHELRAEEVALLLLYHAYPGRVSYDELVKAIKRHGIAQSSAYAGIGKLKNFVDLNDDGWVLRAGGRQKAEALLAGLQQQEYLVDNLDEQRSPGQPRRPRTIVMYTPAVVGGDGLATSARSV